MKIRRRSSNLLIEPPSSATGDIAFNLIIFFLVCASVQPDSGRHQTLPRSEETEQHDERQDKEQLDPAVDSQEQQRCRRQGGESAADLRRDAGVEGAQHVGAGIPLRIGADGGGDNHGDKEVDREGRVDLFKD